MIETYTCGTSNDLVKEKKRLNVLVKQNDTEMVDFDESDHSCRILIIWGSRSGKTDSWFNLINYQPDIDKIYLYA